MELNKYQINRIKASVIEDVAETLLSRLNRAQELLNDEQNELQDMLTRKEELSSWQLPDKEESIKRAEIYVTTWQALLDQLDKSLCKYRKSPCGRYQLSQGPKEGHPMAGGHSHLNDRLIISFTCPFYNKKGNENEQTDKETDSADYKAHTRRAERHLPRQQLYPGSIRHLHTGRSQLELCCRLDGRRHPRCDPLRQGDVRCTI